MSDREPLRIGALAATAGVTVEALRYYEAEGLLRPARDAAGRRTYDAGQQRALELVTTLRGAGFGIREIAGLVAAKQPGRSTEQRLRVALAELDRMRADLETRRAQLDGATALLDEWRAEARAALDRLP